MLAAAHSYDLRVVVLASQCRGVVVPCQSRADTINLVRSHLLAVAATAQHNTQGVQASLAVTLHAKGCVNAERGVVVQRVVVGGAVVNHFVARSGEGLDQVVAQFEASVVGCDVYAHGTLLVILSWCDVRLCVCGRRRFSVLSAVARVRRASIRWDTLPRLGFFCLNCIEFARVRVMGTLLDPRLYGRLWDMALFGVPIRRAHV